MDRSTQALLMQRTQLSPLALLDEPGSPNQAAVIASSRERCVRLGITESTRPDFERPAAGEWRDILERNETLRRQAAPIMATLRERISRAHGMVVLTDASGLILHTLGESDFLERAQKVALMPGVCWAEPRKGTNAIGTALVEHSPTVVHARQHFLKINHFLTCSATPIFDPSGRVSGVLDVTGDQRSYHRHTMALLLMCASMIENSLVLQSAARGFCVHFHPRPEFHRTVGAASVAFDDDGRFVGANRIAREEFGLIPGHKDETTVLSMFGKTIGEIRDLHSAGSATLSLYLAGRLPVFAWVESLTQEAREQGKPVAPPAQTRADPLPSLARLDTGDRAVSAAIGKVRRIVDRQIPLLILGETGTGKELLARAMHADSARARSRFVAVNCAAIPESLIEAELFGYEEGAFTGARRRGNPGRIVQANGGTLFLDEIGDMPVALQARLLRVLQDRQVMPLGGREALCVDFNLICATHRNLRELVANGLFREDLYYRLNGLSVRLPALRERDDLDSLVAAILSGPGEWGAGRRISPQAMALLRRYAWPGNIRQLASVLRTACAMADDDGPIMPEHLPDELTEALMPVEADAPDDSARTHSPGLAELAVTAIERALAANAGNIAATARELRISRNTIYRRLRRHSAD